MGKITIPQLVKKAERPCIFQLSTRTWTNHDIVCKNDSNLLDFLSEFKDSLDKEKFYSCEIKRDKISDVIEMKDFSVERIFKDFKEAYKPAKEIIIGGKLPLFSRSPAHPIGEKLNSPYIIPLVNNDNISWVDLDYYDYLTQDGLPCNFYMKGDSYPIYVKDQNDEIKAILTDVIMPELVKKEYPKLIKLIKLLE